ncbi:TonB system transport protein ExbD [Campylobacter geochelonis]|uniref:TonB system transport protein ExbD n=1 Tax=Campylobacter geochelonis TaxID=1780362 RepID=UPI000770ADA9|nr:TonB system transport protein ExbD [Campylobacter geochelonis]CZE50431.1 TonB system transporter ExbD [Campylobacter geochelonis]
MKKSSKLKKDGLNVVPFIDIMLVLLCIVLSISTFIAQGKIAVELPQSQSGMREAPKDALNIVIDEQSQIYLNDKLVSQEDFNKEINALDAKTLVVLRSDKEAKFESFVKVIDALKMKKHENFAIATQIRE